MPDVGVLNLQIHDNAEKAAQGLESLIGALNRVKSAVDFGSKLGNIATNLGKIGKIIDESIQGSTIAKLNEIGTALEKMKNIGKVNIRISYGKEDEFAAVAKAFEQTEAYSHGIISDTKEAAESAAGMSDGFKNAEESLAKVKIQSSGAREEIEKLKDEYGRIDLNKHFDISKMPLNAMGMQVGEATKEMLQYGKILKDAWEITRGSTEEKIGANFTDSDSIKEMQSATEAASSSISKIEEGWAHVDSSVRSVAINTEEATENAQRHQEIVTDIDRIMQRQAEVKDYANEMIDLNEKIAKDYNVPPRVYSLEETDNMASYVTELDRLEAQAEAASKTYNKFVNTLGTTDMKTIKAAEALNKAREAIDQYRNAMENAKALEENQVSYDEAMGAASRTNQYDLLIAKLDEAREKYHELSNSDGASDSKLASGALDIHKAEVNLQQYTELQEMLKNVSPEIQQFAQRQLDAGVNASTLRNKLFDLDGELKQKKTDFQDASRSAKVFGTSIDEVREFAGHAISPLTNLAKQFVNIARRMAIRAVIRQFTTALQEGVQNVYLYSDAVGGHFAPSMDSAATALAQMRNSVGAALAPAIEALIPVLNTVVSWFITAINYVNQFFALLRGQSTWIRALEVSTKAYDKSTKQAQKTAKAAKELLADWDELNIIQSEGGGGGTGGAFSLPTDYSKMFEEVGVFDKKVKAIFDFIKDNLSDVKKAVIDIGAALLAWKLANSLTGWLGQLASIAAIGFVIKLAFDATSLLDQAYIDSDNIGFLIGDMVMTGALAGIAGKLAEAKFGEGFGLITAGLTFAVSAGATFASIGNAQSDSQREALTLLGGVKAGIAAALAIAGFIRAGINPVLSIAGGLISIALVTSITYSLKIKAEQAEKAEAMAKAAFAETGEGGIKASDYLDALQKEFDAQTAGAKLVLDAYVEVPDLKKKLTDAATEISSFNTIIFKGDGKLTKEDAEAFKENWKIVTSTLNDMNTASYNTILQGLTEALQTKNEELRAQALEIRKTFVMIEKNISAENADIYTEMEEIAGRLGTDAEKAGDLERYEQLYKVFAASTSTGFDEIQKALDKGKSIDFGTAETAVTNAAEFVKSVGESGEAALKEVEEALNAVTDSVEYKRRMEKAKYDAGLIDEETYLSRIAAFDNILDVAKKYAEEKTGAIQEKMNEAYKIIFEQALTAGNGPEFWKTVMLPLIQQATDAGQEVPQAVLEAFAEAINTNRLDFTKIPNDTLVQKIQEAGLTEPGAIADAIRTAIESEFGAAEGDIEHLITDFFVSHSNLGLDATQMQIKNMLGLSGWDLLSKEWKKLYTDSLVEAFGTDTTRSILEQLTADNNEIIELLGEQNPIENDVEIDTTLHEGIEIVTEETTDESGISGPTGDLGPFEEYRKSLEGAKEITTDALKDINDMKLTPPKFDTTDIQQNAGDTATSIESMADRIRGAFQRLDGLSFSFNTGSHVLSGLIRTVIPIPAAANGGIFKSGDVFSANENGQIELMGSYGNKTAVVNNDQVVGAVTNGVAQANSGMESRLGTIETLLNRILQKEFTAKAVPSSGWGAHAARSADAYSKVTG